MLSLSNFRFTFRGRNFTTNLLMESPCLLTIVTPHITELSSIGLMTNTTIQKRKRFVRNGKYDVLTASYLG